MNMDYSAWEGFEIDGAVDTVLSRGDGRRRPTATFRGRAGPRPVPPARPVRPAALERGIHSGLRGRAADRPAGGAGDRAGPAGRGCAASAHVWTFDSHLLWQEPYVIYSQILAATRTVIGRPDGDQPGAPGTGR